MSSIIQLHNVYKTYQLGESQLEVLKAIDLDIQAGEFIAIMGPSGSGKSSMMNILGLLDRPSHGQYFLQTNNVTELSDDALASLRGQTIGFVFQSFFLLPRLSALHNVMLPLQYSETHAHHHKKLALTMLEKVEMIEYASHLPSQLSGGQQQRVAIARALINQPEILLADEPTGALDSKTGATILNLFRQLNKEAGTTTILITHDSQVAQQTKRIIHLKDGCLVSTAKQGYSYGA